MTVGIIIDVFAAGVLLLSAVTDIKHRKVNVYVIILGSLAVMLIHLFARSGLTDFVIGMIPGAVMLVAARVSGQAIGYGDGLLILFLGICFGWQGSLFILLTSLLLISVCGLVLMCFGRANRKTSWPMAPWILAATIIHILLWRQ